MKLKVLSLVLSMMAVSASAAPVQECGKTADSFAFILDVSGSMMENVGKVKAQAQTTNDQKTEQSRFNEKTRMDLAKEFLTKTVTAVEKKTTMTSGLYTVAPYSALIANAERSAQDFTKSLEAIPDTLEVFGRSTWLGERAQAKFNAALSTPEALVLITDGDFESKDEKMSPERNLQAFYQSNPNACIHIVSLAYRDEEKAGIAKLAGVKDCATVTHIEALLDNQKTFDEFISTVYYRDCVMEIQGVNFDFDKSTLKKDAEADLMAAVKVLKAQPETDKIVINGWTDWTGSDAYNQNLSLKRASAVRDFFVAQGIGFDRILIEGKGKSFKYSNKTGEGRWMNRRVEILYGQGQHSKDATKRQ